MIKINKRGFYFATIMGLIIISFVIGFSIKKNMREKELGINDVGYTSKLIIDTFFEGEKVKVYLEKVMDVAKKNAIDVFIKNAGVSERDRCVNADDVVVLKEGCIFNVNNLIEFFKRTLYSSGYLGEKKLDVKDFDYSLKENVLHVSANNDYSIPIKTRAVKSRVVRRGDSELGEDVVFTDADLANVERTRNSLASAGLIEAIRKEAINQDVPESLVFAIITQESGGDIYATPGGRYRVYGLMQINLDAHPKYDPNEQGSECDAKNDVNCNIRAGISILGEYYDSQTREYPSGRLYGCNGETYNSWEAALRRYNGWACEGANIYYVEEVLKLEKIWQGEFPLSVEFGEEATNVVSSVIGMYRIKKEDLIFDVDLSEALNYFRKVEEGINQLKECNLGVGFEGCIRTKIVVLSSNGINWYSDDCRDNSLTVIEGNKVKFCITKEKYKDFKFVIEF